MKILRFILIALFTSLITGGVGFIVLEWSLRNLSDNPSNIFAAPLSAPLIAMPISFVLGYLFTPFDSNKKYYFIVSYLISTGIALAISYLAIWVYWYPQTSGAHSATQGVENFFFMILFLCSPATVSALMVGLCIAGFTRFGYNQRNKSSKP